MPVAQLHIARQLLGHVLGRAHRLVRPRHGDPVPLECLVEQALGLRPVVADEHRPDARRPLDLGRVAPNGLAVLQQHGLLVPHGGDASAHVVHVAVLRDQLERHLLAAAADADRQVRLDRQRKVPGSLRVVVVAPRRGLGPVEHAAHDRQRLAQPAKPLRKSRPELEPEVLVLLSEPGAADPEDRAAAADVVERRRHLRGERRRAERVGAHHQADPDLLVSPGPRR